MLKFPVIAYWIIAHNSAKVPNIFIKMFFHVEIEILGFVHTRDTWFINHQKWNCYIESKEYYFFCNLQKNMAPLARTRMKAKRTSSSFVAKSPFHQRKKMPIFPVPVSSADVEFNQSDSKKRTTEQISAHYLLEKIGRVLDSFQSYLVNLVSMCYVFRLRVWMLNRENLRVHIPLYKQRTETEKTEKMPIFPVPVSSADVEFNQSDSKKRTTEQISAHYLLEKIGRVLDSFEYQVLFRLLYSLAFS